MLNNLKAELVRKGFDNPADPISKLLGCTEKTARNKLNGITPVTIPEALKIVEKYFAKDNFAIDYLFEQFKEPDKSA